MLSLILSLRQLGAVALRESRRTAYAQLILASLLYSLRGFQWYRNNSTLSRTLGTWTRRIIHFNTIYSEPILRSAF